MQVRELRSGSESLQAVHDQSIRDVQQALEAYKQRAQGEVESLRGQLSTSVPLATTLDTGSGARSSQRPLPQDAQMEVTQLQSELAREREARDRDSVQARLAYNRLKQAHDGMYTYVLKLFTLTNLDACI